MTSGGDTVGDTIYERSIIKYNKSHVGTPIRATGGRMSTPLPLNHSENPIEQGSSDRSLTLPPSNWVRQTEVPDTKKLVVY